MSVSSANRYLNRSEMEGNAAHIASAFLARGWSVNAIAAMLGNMESESTINPGIYEGLDSSSNTNGYGLVQWTPNTKYKTWARARGYTYGDINAQIERIQYELDNGLQWISTDAYPITFTEFSISNESPEYLAMAFITNYERPASLNQPNRATQARTWYEFIVNGEYVPNINPPRVKKSMDKLLLYYAGSRR